MDRMKRFGRAMLNILTMMSLVLSLAVASVWVRSQWRNDHTYFVSRDNATVHGIEVLKNRVGLFSWKGDMVWVERGVHYESFKGADISILQHSVLGLEWERESNWAGRSFMTVYIPAAYLLTLFSILPAIRFYRHVRRSRLPMQGHCRSCGYDLRATPDRCPECGAVPRKTTV